MPVCRQCANSDIDTAEFRIFGCQHRSKHLFFKLGQKLLLWYLGTNSSACSGLFGVGYAFGRWWPILEILAEESECQQNSRSRNPSTNGRKRRCSAASRRTPGSSAASASKRRGSTAKSSCWRQLAASGSNSCTGATVLRVIPWASF